MKRSKFTEEQIVGILREQEADEKTADVCRRHGVSSETCLSVEGEVRRPGGLRREAAEGARGLSRIRKRSGGSFSPKNASFHKRSDTEKLTTGAGHILEYLPPYSPDLNKIEPIWAQAKAIRRRTGQSVDELFSRKNGIKIVPSGYTQKLEHPANPARFTRPARSKRCWLRTWTAWCWRVRSGAGRSGRISRVSRASQTG